MLKKNNAEYMGSTGWQNFFLTFANRNKSDRTLV